MTRDYDQFFEDWQQEQNYILAHKEIQERELMQEIYEEEKRLEQGSVKIVMGKPRYKKSTDQNARVEGTIKFPRFLKTVQYKRRGFQGVSKVWY